MRVAESLKKNVVSQLSFVEAISTKRLRPRDPNIYHRECRSSHKKNGSQVDYHSFRSIMIVTKPIHPISDVIAAWFRVDDWMYARIIKTPHPNTGLRLLFQFMLTAHIANKNAYLEGG